VRLRYVFFFFTIHTGGGTPQIIELLFPSPELFQRLGAALRTPRDQKDASFVCRRRNP
jgi:hypothetical protein